MQSAALVEHFIIDNDIVFLGETWIKLGQDDILYDIFDDSIANDNLQIFGKSGMTDASNDYTGRPYGGVAFICKSNAKLCYQEIPCLSDRVTAIKVISATKVQVATMIGVYMPYYDRSKPEKTDNYLETLDCIQLLLDEYGPIGPVKLLGDFNVQLPRRNQIRSNWHKSRGFNIHSKILYDFLAANELNCADFAFDQKMNYTHFQFENSVFSWIDHVFTSNNKSLELLNCSILDHDVDNVSDHLPLRSIIKLNISSDTCINNPDSVNPASRPNWDNYMVRDKYSTLVENSINSMPALNMDGVEPNSIEGHNRINDYINSINHCIITASSEVSHGRQNKQYSPKHFWCPALSQLRDRKRFWWNLWCENGRPRQGQVYEIWKMCKKAFRKYYRFKSCESFNLRYSKMNSLFIQGKPFWNLLKYKRKRNFAMNEDLHGFTKHFQSIMTENGDLSTEQQMISDEVKGRYAKLSHDLIPHNIDVNLMRTYINKLRKKCAPGYDKVTAEHLQYAASDTFCTALASVYRTIYEYNLVPDVLRVGVIIPILKKPTLDVTAFDNYRPITLCSVYAKLLETMMIPKTT